MTRQRRQDRQLVSSGSPYEEPIGFSRALRVGDRVVVAGTAPTWPDGHVDPDVEVQADRCIEIMLTALREAGAGAEDVIRTRTYLVDAADWEAVARSHGRYFGRVRPASTMVVVAGLLDPRWRVEMEAEAVIGPDAGPWGRRSRAQRPHAIPEPQFTRSLDKEGLLAQSKGPRSGRAERPWCSLVSRRA